jgi:uncharacterized membrane protein YqjE
VDSHGDTSTERGLFASIRQLLSTALALAQVRLALLGTEVEQEKLRLGHVLLWLSLGLLCLGLGCMLVCVFIVVWLWESYRLLSLGALALLFLSGGLGLLLAAQRRLHNPSGLFSASLGELARDRAGLDRPDTG